MPHFNARTSIGGVDGHFHTTCWTVIADSCRETMKISGMALWILVAATLFGVVYTSAGAQDMVMEIVEKVPVNRWLILAAMQIILLIFGMFMMTTPY